MGGLIRTQQPKGDLWTIDSGPQFAAVPVNTQSDGPGPRVGHASLLVGNAFIGLFTPTTNPHYVKRPLINQIYSFWG